MRNETEPTEASQQYTAAYAAHYIGHDLPLALRLYKKLMASHPSAREAEYSRMQVQNIVNAVVPKQELLEAQMELVRVHFERDGLLEECEKAGGIESGTNNLWRRSSGSQRPKWNDSLSLGQGADHTASTLPPFSTLCINRNPCAVRDRQVDIKKERSDELTSTGRSCVG